MVYGTKVMWYDIISYYILPRTWPVLFIRTWTRAKIWPGLYFLLLCVFLFMVFEDKCVTQPVCVDICVVCLPKYTVELDWMQTFSPRFIILFFILFYFILFYFILLFIYFIIYLFYFIPILNYCDKPTVAIVWHCVTCDPQL